MSITTLACPSINYKQNHLCSFCNHTTFFCRGPEVPFAALIASPMRIFSLRLSFSALGKGFNHRNHKIAVNFIGIQVFFFKILFWHRRPSTDWLLIRFQPYLCQICWCFLWGQRRYCELHILEAIVRNSRQYFSIRWSDIDKNICRSPLTNICNRSCQSGNLCCKAIKLFSFVCTDPAVEIPTFFF